MEKLLKFDIKTNKHVLEMVVPADELSRSSQLSVNDYAYIDQLKQSQPSSENPGKVSTSSEKIFENLNQKNIEELIKQEELSNLRHPHEISEQVEEDDKGENQEEEKKEGENAVENLGEEEGENLGDEGVEGGEEENQENEGEIGDADAMTLEKLNNEITKLVKEGGDIIYALQKENNEEEEEDEAEVGEEADEEISDKENKHKISENFMGGKEKSEQKEERKVQPKEVEVGEINPEEYAEDKEDEEGDLEGEIEAEIEAQIEREKEGNEDGDNIEKEEKDEGKGGLEEEITKQTELNKLKEQNTQNIQNSNKIQYENNEPQENTKPQITQNQQENKGSAPNNYTKINLSHQNNSHLDQNSQTRHPQKPNSRKLFVRTNAIINDEESRDISVASEEQDEERCVEMNQEVNVEKEDEKQNSVSGASDSCEICHKEKKAKKSRGQNVRNAANFRGFLGFPGAVQMPICTCEDEDYECSLCEYEDENVDVEADIGRRGVPIHRYVRYYDFNMISQMMNPFYFVNMLMLLNPYSPYFFQYPFMNKLNTINSPYLYSQNYYNNPHNLSDLQMKNLKAEALKSQTFTTQDASNNLRSEINGESIGNSRKIKTNFGRNNV